MTLIGRFINQPQRLWARRALFQVHLWTGVTVGLYILIVSLSGSAVVFRRELAKALVSPTLVSPVGRRLSTEELAAAVRKAYPRLSLIKIWEPSRADVAVEVWLSRGTNAGGYGRRERLFDPYTGRDLGDSVPYQPRLVGWLVDLHDDLLGGRRGRLVNGVGAICLTALSLTGLIIWWPGAARWRRSLIVRTGAGWPRFAWDLHSAIGLWMFLFVLMWGVSGIYLAFPDPFSTLVDLIQPQDPSSTQIRFGDEMLAWLARVHFGRAWGTSIKTVWVILGLVPAVLFITGAFMWWNRVLRPWWSRASSLGVSRRAPLTGTIADV
jgi:uncharacterized iron-regulated membrane protein